MILRRTVVMKTCSFAFSMGKMRFVVGPTNQDFFPIGADVTKPVEEEYRARIRDLDLNRDESIQTTLAAQEKACEEVRQHKAIPLHSLPAFLTMNSLSI